MTAQIQDCCKFNDEDYTIIAMSDTVEFNPKNYGLYPTMLCTACQTGYWCGYEVKRNFLILSDLYINDKSGRYPDINGVHVSPQEYTLNRVYKVGIGWFNENVPNYMGHHKYRNLNLSLHYSGYILIGKDHISDCNCIYDSNFKTPYKTLLKLEFDNDKLTNVTDYNNLSSE